MSGWNDPDRWREMVSGADCPICRKASGWDPIATLEISDVMTNDRGPMRGYCWVPLARHAVELHELSPDEGAAYMRDLQRVSRAVQTVTGAVKLNCEIHGNTVPHLHAHIFPRYPGDRFEGRPIDPREGTDSPYGPGELDRFRRDLRAALTEQPHATGRVPKTPRH